MKVLLAIAAWLGLAGVAAAGWARFFRKVGPTPLPPRLEAIEPGPEEREREQGIA